MSDKTTADRIVRFFDCWGDRYSEHRDDPIIGPIFLRACEEYDRLKRTNDFQTSKKAAQFAAVQEILKL